MNISMLRYFSESDRQRVVSMLRPIMDDAMRREFDEAYEQFIRDEELRYEAMCQDYEYRNTYLDLQNEVIENDLHRMGAFDDLPF